LLILALVAFVEFIGLGPGRPRHRQRHVR